MTSEMNIDDISRKKRDIDVREKIARCSMKQKKRERKRKWRACFWTYPWGHRRQRVDVRIPYSYEGDPLALPLGYSYPEDKLSRYEYSHRLLYVCVICGLRYWEVEQA